MSNVQLTPTQIDTIQGIASGVSYQLGVQHGLSPAQITNVYNAMCVAGTDQATQHLSCELQHYTICWSTVTQVIIEQFPKQQAISK